MIHNAWAEMGANAKLFYDAFRGLCRMRIAYANEKNCMYTTFALSCVTDELYDSLLKQATFWSNVAEYWEGKLELSYKWEKDYFGPEKPLEVLPAEKLETMVVYGKSLDSEV